MQYECEIEGCYNRTNDFLCEKHQKEAEEGTIVICEVCMKIVKVEELQEVKYRFVKECICCQKIGPEMP